MVTMQTESKLTTEEKETRRRVYKEVRDAFAEKYSFIGAQTARECLLSAASWNIDKYSDPPMRFRNHIMLTWEPGWLKSHMLHKMRKVFGDELVSTCGKLTGAVLRGSISNGNFSPPKVLKSPIVISTEFGQTQFDDELLSSFLALLEEGETNVSLNKIAGISESAKSNVQEKYGDQVSFGAENEFDLKTSFVFWGATHDPEKLTENALKTRFNIITPNSPLTGEVTRSIDKTRPVESFLNQDTIKTLRRIVTEEKEVSTNFKPPDALYTTYDPSPRESRDVQSYMAARNWWGLDVNPDIMEEYIKHLQHSRKIADMTPGERVKELIFDSPKTYQEIQDATGYTELEIHNIFQRIDADRAGTSDQTKWVVRSGKRGSEGESEKDTFLGGVE